MGSTNKTFEFQLERLQEIVEQLESGELPLEKGMQLYKEGVSLVKGCRKKLEQARHEVEILSREEWTPFTLEEQIDEETGEVLSGGSEFDEE